MSGEHLPVSHAVALGLIQGPAELLPISSSSHTALIPWLMRWRSARLDVEQRRSLDVALHAGTAAALVLGGAARVPLRTPPASMMLLATAPPAAAGYMLDRFIDRRLSSPHTIALGLLLGAGCMAASDRAVRRDRRAQDAGALDGLLLGAAQVLALAPGISRNGATLAVARARGFGRADADVLSWQVGVPVIAGAAALKLSRERRRSRANAGVTLLAGAASAFASTLASARAIDAARSALGAGRSEGALVARGATGRLAPYAAYRMALALVVMRRVRQERTGGARGRLLRPVSRRRRTA